MNFYITWLEEVGSTNTYLSDIAKRSSALKSGMIVCAKKQTAGRGRSGRKWMNPSNTNLCFSIYIQTDVEPIELPSLTMATALAIHSYLQSIDISSAPKWPNDVLVRNKKISGILSERTERGIVIGVGLNVNMTPKQLNKIDRPATSILSEKPTLKTSPEETLQNLLPHIAEKVADWSNGGFAAIKKEWTLLAGPIGRPLKVHEGNQLIEGTLAGFGPHGELNLQFGTAIRTIWSGEIIQT